MKIYYEKDVKKNVLKGKTIAIVGYGSQGHAHALNLKDSGFKVIVAQRPGGPNHRLAKSHGFKPVSAAQAAKKADLIAILVPDPAQARLYKEEIAPNIKDGAAVLFSHGFNIHYDQIVPAAGLDVIMIAPKGPGHLVRREYEQGAGVPSLVAIHQDATGQALAKALAYASGLGAARAGVIETTFKEETETDLFGEQSVLCGGISELMIAGWETLVDAGYQPEVAYFECVHEVKLIVDLIYEGGLDHMRYSISETAEYGDLTRGTRVIGPEVRATMRKILTDVQSGEFAKEWILENQAGLPMFKALRRRSQAHPIQEVGKKLRSMMGWLKK